MTSILLSKISRDDFVRTYFTLRLALGVLALSLPLALYVGGWWLQGIRLQPSISAYYHSDVRDIMVGMLCAIGCGLIAYKGFSRREDWALNLGGVLACCIALFPMNPADALACIQPGCVGECLEQSLRLDRTADVAITSKLHYPAAMSFYVVLGFVMIFCSHSTLHLVPAKERRWYLAAYPTLGVLFVGSMVAVYMLLNSFAPTATEECRDRWKFWVEVAGIASFAAFWLVKTLECAKHKTDRRIPNRRQPRKTVHEPSEAPTAPEMTAPSVATGAPTGLETRSRIGPFAWTHPAWVQYKSLWWDDPHAGPTSDTLKPSASGE